MGSKLSCCKANTPRVNRKSSSTTAVINKCDVNADDSGNNLQHISDREPEDIETDPSTHPTAGPLFMQRSRSDVRNCKERRSHAYLQLLESRPLKKCSSCSTIFIDDSTVSHPDLKNTIKCVTLAIYYHIKNRTSNNVVDIFDEKIFPLSRDCSVDESKEPDHKAVYRFVRTLFNAAQLSSECAIITLVYLERLLTYAEIDISPTSWRRIVLGAILLASKVWDDQAVWNVDYCQILKDITVEDMNELERNFLELLQFNINVPSSVYAKYYFDLRTLANQNDLTFPVEQLSKEKAQRLEAMSRGIDEKLIDCHKNGMKKWSSVESISPRRQSKAILS